MTLHAGARLEGVLRGYCDSGPHKDAFAVIEVPGVRELLFVPENEVSDHCSEIVQPRLFNFDAGEMTIRQPQA